MIKQGDVIKHVRNIDVAIQVMYTSVNPETKNLWVKGIWLNQGFVKSWVINSRKYPAGIPVELDITEEQSSNWLKCSSPFAKCIRYEDWKPLK
jgi:hypothetical protein